MVKERRNVYEVTIIIEATKKAYAARLAFTDGKGKRHTKEIEKQSEGTENSNTLRAVIDSMETLQRPCMLDIQTNSDYLISPIRNGWAKEWEMNGWRNAKNQTIANCELWKCLIKQLANHSVKFTRRER